MCPKSLSPVRNLYITHFIAYNLKNIEDVIIAPISLTGRAAVSLLRITGPKSIELTERIFSNKELSPGPAHTLFYGELFSLEGEFIDQVLVSKFCSPNSYTGQDTIEVSCHGSNFIVERIIQLYISLGARLAEKGEFTFRAYMNGKMDLVQAEAVASIIEAESKLQHKIASTQLRGKLSSRILELRTQLIDLASLLELELDFSEEDVEFANRTKLIELLNAIKTEIESLLSSFDSQQVIKKGISTVILGVPNVGKSTLLNALLDEDRAIVTSIAGTTTDTIEDELWIKGIQFRLTDTAGIRASENEIEQKGIDRSMLAVRNAELIILLLDGTKPLENQIDFLDTIDLNEKRVIVAINKIDAFNDQIINLPNSLSEQKHLKISALQNTNVNTLKDEMHTLATSGLDLSNISLTVNARHKYALTKAQESILMSLTGFQENLSTDLIALNLRYALNYLGEITGEVHTDELLDNIFSNFCIGK